MVAPDPDLAAGEAALQAGDYGLAIAHLEGVCTVELDPATLQRAQQALVVAYTRGDRLPEALHLCQHLAQAPAEHPWAVRALADLRARQQRARAEQFQPPGAKSGRRQSPSSSQEAVKLPIPYQPAEAVAVPAPFVSGRAWRNGERAQNWRKLRPLKLRPLGLLQAIAALVLLWVVRVSVEWSLIALYRLSTWLPGPSLPGWLYPSLTQPLYSLLALAALVFLGAPWLLDAWLRWRYGQTPYSLPRLASQYPETAKVLQTMARQRRWPLPQLRLLPTQAPVAFTYGHLPRTARIVLSEGLLERLPDDELATLAALQFAAIAQGHAFFLAGAVSLLQLPFALYEAAAAWGEGDSGVGAQGAPWLQTSRRWLGGLTAALAYGAFWLWRLPLLYVARRRWYYADRWAAEFTGHPNGLSRALLKMAIGLAQHVESREQTIGLLESLELLMPVGVRQALSLGSLPDKTPLETVLAWECRNPYRHWLALINAHPLLGDRLYLLNRYGNYWGLTPEIDLPPVVPPVSTWGDRLRKLRESYRALPILQSAVLSGLILGTGARLALWLIGALSNVLAGWLPLPLWRLIWFYNARPATVNWLQPGRSLRALWSLIWLREPAPFWAACVLVAFSLSIIVWINGYFPDVRISPRREEPRLVDLLSDPQAVPPQSQGVRLTGKLLGRRGVSNWLGQDLVLQTATGDIKLHFVSKLGPLGNLWPRPPRPEQFLGQTVTVLGWFRRGSMPWVDVDVIQGAAARTRSGYPVWVTGLAIAAAMGGTILIWRV